MLCWERPGLSGGRCWTRKTRERVWVERLQAGRSPARRRSPLGDGRGRALGVGWGLGEVGNLPGGEVDNQKSRSRRTTFFEEFPRAQNAVLCRGVGALRPRRWYPRRRAFPQAARARPLCSGPVPSSRHQIPVRRGRVFFVSSRSPRRLSRSELVHQAECLPERPSSTVERLQLNGAEEKRHQVGVFYLNELVEFSAHVRDIEDLSEREVLGDGVHDLVYDFVFFHKRLFGKNLGEFPRAASFLVPERRRQRRGNCGLPLPLVSMARTKACSKLPFLFRCYRIPFS